MTPGEMEAKAKSMEAQVRSIVESVDGQGRWVQDGWIYSKTFAKNIVTLSRYLNYSGWRGPPRVPRIDSYLVSISGEGLLVRVNVSLPNESADISRVFLTWTPPNDLSVTELSDDGAEPDRLPADREFACVLDPDHGEWKAVFQGVLVAEDSEGHWNLSVLPLGLCDSTRDLYGEVNRSLQEAIGTGVDVGDAAQHLAEIHARMQAIGSEEDAQRIYRQLENLSQQLDRLVLTGLIAKAERLIDSAEESGLDVSRHRLFLEIARQRFEEGNYQSARQFLGLPLGLEARIGEGYRIELLLLFAICLWCLYGSTSRFRESS